MYTSRECKQRRGKREQTDDVLVCVLNSPTATARAESRSWSVSNRRQYQYPLADNKEYDTSERCVTRSGMREARAWTEEQPAPGRTGNPVVICRSERRGRSPKDLVKTRAPQRSGRRFSRLKGPHRSSSAISFAVWNLLRDVGLSGAGDDAATNSAPSTARTHHCQSDQE